MVKLGRTTAAFLIAAVVAALLEALGSSHVVTTVAFGVVMVGAHVVLPEAK
jgi:hypothetical protein